jgi:hypothetical protein
MASPDPAGLKAKPEPRPKPHITDLPMTWANWHKHVNWLNVYFIAGIPLIGCVAAVWTPLRLQTAIWAVLYYFFTGMGAFSDGNPFPLTTARHHRRLPQTVGPQVVLGYQAPGTVPRSVRRRRHRRLHPLVEP